MKTIIEIFDESPIENVISALAYEPEKIIYIGFKNAMTESRKASVERFLKLRGIYAKVCYEIVSRYDYEAIKEKLKSIIDQNPDSILDLTGGKELVLAAMGAVCEEANLPTVQFDIQNDKVAYIKNCHSLPKPKMVCLTIEECVVLNGGAIIENDFQKLKLGFSDEFKKDIELGWKIRNENSHLWGDIISALRRLENMSSENGSIYQEIPISKSEILKNSQNADLDIIKPLSDNGLVFVNKRGNHYLSIKYKSYEVYRMLLKVGNVFELYTYCAADEIAMRNTKNLSPAGMGVFLDWDGIIHPYFSNKPDTINEVDIILTKGVCPVFISCKSGDLKKEALYELDTVANKFGGKYSKKIIVTNNVSRNQSSKASILQRAKDMGIDVIYDVDKMSREQFIKKLEEKL